MGRFIETGKERPDLASFLASRANCPDSVNAQKVR
jgi:hypothetical protein